MRALQMLLVLGVAFLSIFWEATFDGFRRLTATQPHLLPGLMVYTALRGSTFALALLACVGGLAFDSISSNPLGISVLPLLAVGITLRARRGLILQDQVFAQSVLGAAASVITPALTLLLLLTLGEHPLMGWGTLWQFIVLGAVGALAGPAFFLLFEWLESNFAYARAPESSFRSDREIRRGK